MSILFTMLWFIFWWAIIGGSFIIFISWYFRNESPPITRIELLQYTTVGMFTGPLIIPFVLVGIMGESKKFKNLKSKLGEWFSKEAFKGK